MGTHELVSLQPWARSHLVIHATSVHHPVSQTDHVQRIFNRPSRTTILEQDPEKNKDKRLWFDVDYMVVQVPIPECVLTFSSRDRPAISAVRSEPYWTPMSVAVRLVAVY